MDLGLLYVIIGELLWAGEIIFIRKFFQHNNPFFVAAAGSIVGSLFYLPVFFASKEKLSLNSWVVMIIYAFSSWFLAQIFYVAGIQKSSNALGITFAVLSLPLFTLILSALFLKEALTVKTIVGGIVMIIGFLIISL
ncbi:DMT family transporter [Patescibacteria group bacterium]|nr:DMT family transporter [Patescibacteria group bacterium]